jgi:hypothetical protein
MKTIIYTAALIAFSLNLPGQNDLNLVDTSNLWSDFSSWELPPPGDVQSQYVRFSGDTTINLLDYKKVWTSNTALMTNWSLAGFIRSDADNQVYLRDTYGWEGLIYKFDLLPGDTFTMYNPFGSYIFVAEVLEVDSIFIEPSNEKRKRIRLGAYEGMPWNQEEYWIEGIGSLAGILNSGQHIYPLTCGGDPQLLCYLWNGNVVYSNPDFNSCYITGVTENGEDLIAELNIHPLPLSDQTIISINNYHGNNLTIEIRDISGKLIYTHGIDQNNEIGLYRNDFKSGCYFVTLKDKTNAIKTKKLIVH